MKRGGQIVYSGELGQDSCKLIEYFEVSYKLTTLHIILLCKPFRPFILKKYNTAKKNHSTNLEKTNKSFFVTVNKSSQIESKEVG